MLDGMRILALVVFVGWSVCLSLVDVRERRLPNRLTAAGAAGVLGYAAAHGQLRPAAVGGVVLAAIYLVVHLAAPAAFGAGDVKLALATGAAAALGGAHAWAVAALLAPAATAAVGIVRWAVRGGRGECPVLLPHGPSMCGATLFALAFGG
jgi:leader peptidase (prepilin peptidase)/N-methyltransferase